MISIKKNINRITFANMPKEAGIYLILAKSNGFRYIGSSINMAQRTMYSHRMLLRTKKHDNILMQNHVDQYGISDLLFFVLEYCEPSELIQKENEYITNIKPEFNICKAAYPNKRKRRKRISTKKCSSNQKV